jgi:alpha-ketoglutarate-dependent taurine dioxygenase
MPALVRYGADIGSDVHDLLRRDGALVVWDFPIATDAPLVRFASDLGRVSETAVTAAGGGRSLVHDVAALPEPLLNPHGQVVLSTTTDPFDLHTDDYFLPEPSDVVILLCVRQAGVGGESLIAPLDEVLGRLDATTRALLHEPVFPTPFGPVAILTEVGGSARVRYNRSTIRLLAANGVAVPAPHADALDAFDGAARASSRTFRLSAGQCLVADNGRLLHGRRAFEGHRLLRRMKVYRR